MRGQYDILKDAAKAPLVFMYEFRDTWGHPSRVGALGTVAVLADCPAGYSKTDVRVLHAMARDGLLANRCVPKGGHKYTSTFVITAKGRRECLSWPVTCRTTARRRPPPADEADDNDAGC